MSTHLSDTGCPAAAIFTTDCTGKWRNSGFLDNGCSVAGRQLQTPYVHSATILFKRDFTTRFQTRQLFSSVAIICYFVRILTCAQCVWNGRLRIQQEQKNNFGSPQIRLPLTSDQAGGNSKFNFSPTWHSFCSVCTMFFQVFINNFHIRTMPVAIDTL